MAPYSWKLIRSVLLLASIPSLSAQSPTDYQSLKDIPSETIDVKLRQIESEAAWKSDKEILTHSVVVLEETLKELDRQIHEKELQSSNLQKSLHAAEGRLTSQQAGQTLLLHQIASLEAATRELARFAPPPLKEKIERSLARLGDGDGPESISLRIQAIASILTQFDQFNKTHTEVRTLHEFENGARKEVRILYIGLAQAIAIDTQATRAWILKPSADAWIWSERPDNLSAIENAFQAYDRDIPARFFPISVDVSNPNVTNFQ